MDETRAPVLDPGSRKTKTGYFWALARDDRPWGGGAPPGVAFTYAPGRGRLYAERVLQGFAGVLQVDGYAGYGKGTVFDLSDQRRFDPDDIRPAAVDSNRRLLCGKPVEQAAVSTSSLRAAATIARNRWVTESILEKSKTSNPLRVRCRWVY
jgi:hypothetical protein